MWKWWCLSGAGDMKFIGDYEEFDEAYERAEEVCGDYGVLWLFDDAQAADILKVLEDTLKSAWEQEEIEELRNLNGETDAN